MKMFIIECTNCTVNCAYTLNELPYFSQTHINKELGKHKHVKSRKMPNGHFRRTEEARTELGNHYRYAHQMN